MRLAALVAFALALAACSDGLPETTAERRFEVTGPFEPGEEIPRRFTCDGADESPPLRWQRVAGATSYVLVVHDIDAGDFVHWVAWGIDPGTTELPVGELPSEAAQGTNSFGDVGYSGPCPPPDDDPHTYLFTVYAVGDEADRDLDESTEAADALEAIEDSVIASGRLHGTYDR
jgi:Raf kinase inhibitor-like YbhB/YbcL family protein